MNNKKYKNNSFIDNDVHMFKKYIFVGIIIFSILLLFSILGVLNSLIVLNKNVNDFNFYEGSIKSIEFTGYDINNYILELNEYPNVDFVFETNNDLVVFKDNNIDDKYYLNKKAKIWIRHDDFFKSIIVLQVEVDNTIIKEYPSKTYSLLGSLFFIFLLFVSIVFFGLSVYYFINPIKFISL